MGTPFLVVQFVDVDARQAEPTGHARLGVGAGPGAIAPTERTGRPPLADRFHLTWW
jgi:hypothetical protein